VNCLAFCNDFLFAQCVLVLGTRVKASANLYVTYVREKEL
jgi:hypothetical protein